MKLSDLLYWHYFLADDYRRMSLLLKASLEDKKIIENESEISEILQFTPIQRNKFKAFQQSYTPQAILNDLQQKSITPITLFDPLYPPLLKEIYDPPYVLYSKGNNQLLSNDKMISMIGTRKPTPYGETLVATLINQLKDANHTIVSGLATGIDGLVHRTCIKENIPTIGVLGSGFDYFYPEENRSLASQMVKKNLIITEYPPPYRPKKWYFPKRNRIISGMSKGVVVIEAKEKSGSLITADQALEQGREVFSCPGSIFSKESMGTNYLILQGAKLVMSASDILSEIEGIS
ncbi:MAG: DNA-processing protein DprA [Bacillaceae bacterium]